MECSTTLRETMNRTKMGEDDKKNVYKSHLVGIRNMNEIIVPNDQNEMRWNRFKTKKTSKIFLFFLFQYANSSRCELRNSTQREEREKFFFQLKIAQIGSHADGWKGTNDLFVSVEESLLLFFISVMPGMRQLRSPFFSCLLLLFATHTTN